MATANERSELLLFHGGGHVNGRAIANVENGDSCTDPTAATDWREEAILLINLAIPTIVIQVGAMMPPVLTASFVGRHLGPVALDGFALANLTGNLFTLSILEGLYTASDTLSPQAFAAGNYKEVGLLAIRGYAASLLLLVPSNAVLVFLIDMILLAVGENPTPSHLAKRWYRIYVLGLPFYALYMVTWKFLSAQGIMTPLVVVMTICTAVLLPVLLQVFVPLMGLEGSAVAIVVFQVSQATLLLSYLYIRRPHKTETWNSNTMSLVSWREAVAWEPLWRFLRLGVGGMLANAEWWYWEVVSLMIGTMGVVPLSVHAVPTQVLTVTFMLPMGVGIALSIRLGHILPLRNGVCRAKQVTLWTMLIGGVVFGILSVLMYVMRQRIFLLFVNDPDVLLGCERIWWKVCVYNFLLSVFAIYLGIATGLGMQLTLGCLTSIFLWVGNLPALWISSVLFGGGLETAWSWIYPPYLLLNVVLMWKFTAVDWNEIRLAIRKREGLERAVGSKQDVTGDYR